MPVELKTLTPTKKYFVFMFLISCVLLAVFTLVIYQQSRLNEHSNNWVIHSYEVMRNARNALLHVYDGDMAERNYLETGTPAFLRSYNENIRKADADVSALMALVADNSTQQANSTSIRTALDQFKRNANAEIGMLRKRKITTYSLAAHLILQEKIIGEIRTKIFKFNEAESDILNARVAESQTQRRNFMLTLFIGAILDLGAFIIANMLIFSLAARSTRAEEKIRESEQLFVTILDAINDGIYDYNVLRGTIYYSPSYLSILGYSEKELEFLSSSHDNCYAYIHPDDVEMVKEYMRRYFAREIPSYCMAFRMRHGDGHWVWLLSRAVGLWDEHGKIRRLIGTHMDITAQKQREEELKYFIAENERQKKELEEAKERAETASQAKSDFLATMSHEIRTPLNVVIGLSRLLMDKVQTPQKREMAETLYANADILLKLVNDLLDLTRIESAQIELDSRSFSFGSLLKSLRAMFDNQITGKGLSFSLIDYSDDQTLIGDSVRIQQILVNLVSNALKFTAHGGITVTSDCVLRDGGVADVTLTVADTGIGIPPEKLENIFEKFVQADQTISRRFGGSGLGLAISKSLAQLMGGDISVVSKSGEGSVFTVTLRLKAGRAQEIVSAPKLPTVKTPRGRGTVLVVEDYAANVMVATMMLENLGYAVEAVSSGTEAVEKIKNRRAPYTAILMDVQMQDMDGFETTRRIRALEKEKGFRHFIIGVTAHALAGDRDKCIEAGMDDYMSKPVHPDLLARKLGSVSKKAA